MLKSNLLLLIQKLMEENIDIKRLVNGSLIQKLTDEEILLITSDEFKECRVNLIYLLNILKNSDIDEENKKLLIEQTKLIDTKEKLTSAIEFIKYSLENRKDNSNDKKIIEGYRIIASSEGNIQALIAKRLLLEDSIETAKKVSKLKASNQNEEEKINKELIQILKKLTKDKKLAIYSYFKYADVVETMLKAKSKVQIKKMSDFIADNRNVSEYAENSLNVVEIITLSNEEVLPELYVFLENVKYTELKSNDIIEIAKLMAQAKDEKRASSISYLIKSNYYYFINISLKKEIAKIILSAKSEYNANEVLKVFDALSIQNRQKEINNPNFLDILKVISKCDIANTPYISVVIKKGILANNDAFKIINLIGNAKNDNQAYIISTFLIQNKMNIDSKLLELASLIINSKCNSKKILECVIKVAECISNDKSMDLVSVVLNSVGELQAEYAKDIAINVGELSPEKAVELAKIAATTKKLYNLEYVHRIVTNSELLKTPIIVELANRASQVEENKLIELTEEEEQILQDITFKINDEPIFNGTATYNIYDLLANNQGIIENILKDMPEEDIKPDTKVRIRVLKDNERKDK